MNDDERMPVDMYIKLECALKFSKYSDNTDYSPKKRVHKKDDGESEMVQMPWNTNKMHGPDSQLYDPCRCKNCEKLFKGYPDGPEIPAENNKTISREYQLNWFNRTKAAQTLEAIEQYRKEELEYLSRF